MISVIITAHNQAPFIGECLESFLKDPAKKEIIVVDDNSQDDTEQVVNKYPVKYYKVKYNNADKSRNYGFNKSKGQFIQHFDGDDYLTGELLTESRKFLIDNNLDFCYSPFSMTFPLKMSRLPTNEIEFNPDLLKLQSEINTIGMVRREYWRKWDPKLHCQEDWDFWLSVTKNTTNGARLPKRLWEYRIHDFQKSDKKMINSAERNKDRLYVRKKHNLPDFSKIDFSLIIMVSREVYLSRLLDWVEKCSIDKKNTHLIIVDHTKSNYAFRKFNEQLGKWATIRIKKVYGKRLAVANPIRWRRIAGNLNLGLKMVTTKYYGVLEDDTIPDDRDVYNKLIKTLKNGNDIALVEAVEIARQSQPGINASHIGAWDIIERNGKMITAVSKTPPSDLGIEQISGSGFYCYVGRIEAVRRINYITTIYKGISGGPDILFAKILTDFGWKCFIDWSLNCTHLQVEPDGSILEFHPNSYEIIIRKKPFRRKYD